MIQKILFPHGFKVLGWIMLAIFIVPAVYGITTNDPLNVLTVAVNNTIIIGMTLSLIFVAFSREKDEDEFTASMRGDSLTVAILVNYALVCIATLLFNDFDFLYVALINFFSILLLHIVIFNTWLSITRKRAGHEK